MEISSEISMLTQKAIRFAEVIQALLFQLLT